MNTADFSYPRGVARTDRRTDKAPVRVSPHYADDRELIDRPLDDIFMLSQGPQPVWPRVFPGL